ncbi:MAG TPA: hypothetical protein PKH98_06275, partial [Candidatus Omnitrophota bacterium]|nr:hypothetical protein [Candidatus Omnitrophota bacterium]
MDRIGTGSVVLRNKNFKGSLSEDLALLVIEEEDVSGGALEPISFSSYIHEEDYAVVVSGANGTVSAGLIWKVSYNNNFVFLAHARTNHGDSGSPYLIESSDGNFLAIAVNTYEEINGSTGLILTQQIISEMLNALNDKSDVFKRTTTNPEVMDVIRTFLLSVPQVEKGASWEEVSDKTFSLSGTPQAAFKTKKSLQLFYNNFSRNISRLVFAGIKRIRNNLHIILPLLASISMALVFLTPKDFLYCGAPYLPKGSLGHNYLQVLFWRSFLTFIVLGIGHTFIYRPIVTKIKEKTLSWQVIYKNIIQETIVRDWKLWVVLGILLQGFTLGLSFAVMTFSSPFQVSLFIASSVIFGLGIDGFILGINKISTALWHRPLFLTSIPFPRVYQMIAALLAFG